MKKKQGGFTLIELMITVTILAILITMAVPTMSKQIAIAQMRESFQIAKDYKYWVQEYYMLKGEFPSNNDAIQVASDADGEGRYVKTVVVANGRISLLFKDEAHPLIAKKTIKFTPKLSAGKFDNMWWLCSSADIKVLPLSCQ